MNGKEFWAEIEAPQGFAFVADSICDADDAGVRREAARRLPWAQRVVEILRRAKNVERHRIVRAKRTVQQAKGKKISQTQGWFGVIRNR
jgi:hypothetical protein